MHTAIQIPQWNQHNSFLHIPKLGTIVRHDPHQPHHYRLLLLKLTEACSSHFFFFFYNVTTSSPLRKLYFWHF